MQSWVHAPLKSAALRRSGKFGARARRAPPNVAEREKERSGALRSLFRSPPPTPTRSITGRAGRGKELMRSAFGCISLRRFTFTEYAACQTEQKPEPLSTLQNEFTTASAPRPLVGLRPRKSRKSTPSMFYMGHR